MSNSNRSQSTNQVATCRVCTSTSRCAIVALTFPLLLTACAVFAEDGASSQRLAFRTTATPAEQIRLPNGFEVELLYSVPKESEGSWVNLCVDPKGRLITSDQFGSLYRVTLITSAGSERVRVEKISAEIGQAQGLVWAFDSLYVVVNGGDVSRNGLYRVRDIDGDDQLDSVELLRLFEGNGEHGPHAVLLAPDGQSLFVVCGNSTNVAGIARSRVPEIWDEDRLLPRVYGVGYMRGVPAPGGTIYRLNPLGQKPELVASGFRNPFDIAINAAGELFTFDSDMEWDLGTPWYRPSRICHVVSGSDWGWRNGSAKWPEYFADTLPPVLNIGRASPTGISFGYGAKFPAKYQQALFLCDWTYGTMYAVQLQRQGASYTGTAEEFMSAAPLPLTDVAINPHDGAMYFVVGGRMTQSGLYRVVYTGTESVSPIAPTDVDGAEYAIRRKLESLHVTGLPNAANTAWPYLNHADRFIRFAARTALEHQPLECWQERALRETDAQTSLSAILALVRKISRVIKPSGVDLDTPPPSYPAEDAARHPLQSAVFAALARLDWQSLSKEQRCELLRAYQLAFYRLGPPDEEARGQLIERLDRLYPSKERELNVMLTELLSYLQAPSAAEKGIKLLAAVPTQEVQLDLVRSLQFLNSGWSLDSHRALYQWLLQAHAYKGGNNFAAAIQELRDTCLDNTSAEHRSALHNIIHAELSAGVNELASQPSPFVKEWQMEEVASLMETKMKGRNYEHGRAMFAAANCYKCHQFAGEGGAVGPDLTALASRFSPHDILDSVLNPNKVISDQYAASVILTATGKTIVGRLTDFNAEVLTVNTNIEDPKATETIDRNEIDSIERSDISMMPSGLLNTLHEDEILDLMAFLLSRGDPHSPLFTKDSSNE